MSLTERYELIRVIGVGGMAQVFEGLARGAGGFERRVAIKRLVPEHAGDESYQRMFLDEARIASYLHHANIVQVLDYGSVDGEQFLVLEHVDGLDGSRAARLGARCGAPIPIAVALHVVTEIAHALQYAHARSEAGRPLGIVHRDVSPANVLLSWEGDAKLSDFGIALATVREERTRTGMIKGKLCYMPPEQAAGQPLTGAADVYALGATLAALAFGAAAPEDRDPARLQAHPEVLALVERCTTEEPDRRPGAADVAAQAEALRAGARASAGTGRAELRRWLAALRPHAATPSKPHAFDRMLGLCLVPAGDGARSFTVSQAAATVDDRPTPRARGGQDSASGSVSGEKLPSPRLGGWRGASAALLGVALVAGLAVAVVALLSANEVPAPGLRETKAPVLEADAMTFSLADRADARPAVPRDAAGPTPTPDASRRRGRPPSRRAAARRPAPRARGAARQVTKSARAPAPPPRGSGWLRVGGAALLRARIEIDDKLVGHAPAALELGLGGHRLVVRAPGDRRVLVDRRITVEETHRRSAPLRVIVR